MPAVWRAYLDDKLRKHALSKSEEAAWRAMIDGGCCRAVTERLTEPGYCFAPPEKRLISKHGNAKKRVIYLFSTEENAVLKVMASLLYRYDGCLSPHCYSFRKNISAATAIRRVASLPDRAALWGYKVDIANYFNSVDVSLLLPILRDVLMDDPMLYAFLSRLLTQDLAVWEGETVHEKRGIMAGMPLSPFLANLYLGELDRHFDARGVPCARYSDDILLFCGTEAARDLCRDELLALLNKHHLDVNPEKEQHIRPGAPFAFLGVRIDGASVDVAPSAVRKMQGKIRRKSRALRRWMLRTGAEPERALSAFCRSVNRKLYEQDAAPELFSWSRWYFPLVNRTDGLHQIDRYLQQYMRYLLTGRTAKSNYRIGYQVLKDCGYRPLVSAYYRFRNDAEKGNP